MASFGLGEYVVGINTIYFHEGTIIGMHESTGSRKGMLYTVKDKDNGCEFSFFENEITKLAIPTMYDHTLCEMAKEWFYLAGNKRLAKCNIYRNSTRRITKGGAYNNTIYLTFTAYGKSHTYFTTLEKIKECFKTKRPIDYAHYGI